MALEMSLKQSQDLGKSSIINKLAGISLQELESLIDQTSGCVSDIPINRRIKSAKNFFPKSQILNDYSKVKDTIPNETYLANPLILVNRNDDGYSFNYNNDLVARVRDKVRVLEDDNFAKSFERNISWTIDQQLKIMKYLFATQSKYLESGNPFDMEEIKQDDIAKHIGYSVTSVSKLLRNLTVKLPNGNVIFAEQLVPSYKLDSMKGLYIIRQLQQDVNLYDSDWKISDFRLSKIIKERYGLDIKRRTLTKYMSKL